MPSILPTAEQVQAMIDAGLEGPIVMVNLLKFRDKAEYASDKPEATESLSGREAYRRYGVSIVPIFRKTGAGIVYIGAQKLVLVGGAQDEWDDVVLVRYPSRQAFIAMTMSAEYNAINYHRDAGLERTALLCTTEGVAT